MKILLTGSTGQLGREIINLAPNNIDLITPKRNELNLSDVKMVENTIMIEKPNWIINCGAFTDVEKAEKETELSKRVNSHAPEAFTKALNKINSNLLHISSDYVFDGNQNRPYKENQKRNPLSYYGYTKALGEELISKNINNLDNATILRTSWLIGPVGKNFVLKILKLHSEREYICVVSDQISVPTRSRDLAKACWQIVRLKKSKKLPFIMHWSDAGIASWYDIAVEIGNLGIKLGLLKKKAIVKPIKSEEYTSLAKRPRYSLLSTQESAELLEMKPKHWKENLKEILIDFKSRNF